MKKPTTTASYLASRPYPGRGLVLSRSSNGAVMVSIFLTGRSHASQARKMILAPGALEVVPTDGAADDPLRHYFGIIARGTRLVAGNGRHVSEVAASERGPSTAVDEIKRQTYEPDPPIFTPRLTAIVDLSSAPLALLGIAFRGPSGDIQHQLERVPDLKPSEAWLMHTYDGNIETPVARGYIAHLRDDTEAFGLQEIWNALHPQYRVAVGSVTARPGTSWASGEWNVKNRE